MEEIFGYRPAPPVLRKPGPLDGIFASRSHVRVLRVLFRVPTDYNLTIRDLARCAGVSHPRVGEVVRQLQQHGVVHLDLTPWGYTLVRLKDSFPLQFQLARLYEAEGGVTRFQLSPAEARPSRP